MLANPFRSWPMTFSSSAGRRCHVCSSHRYRWFNDRGVELGDETLDHFVGRFFGPAEFYRTFGDVRRHGYVGPPLVVAFYHSIANIQHGTPDRRWRDFGV